MLKRLIITTSALLLLSATAQACSCLGWPTPEEEYDRSDVVFKGYCEEMTIIGYNAYARLQVHASWKGNPAASVLVKTWPSSASCGIEFEVGQTYLVYGTDNEDLGDYYTHFCTRTSVYELCGDDIDYLGAPAVVHNEYGTWGNIKAAYR